MTTRAATLEAELATIPNVTGLVPTTVVALPPSSLDPSTVVDGTSYDDTTVYDASTVYFATYLFSDLRVYVGGSLILRAYDQAVT